MNAEWGGWLQSFVPLLLLLSPIACAAQVTFTWDAVDDPDVAGYVVYYGYSPGDYVADVDVGLQTTYTFTDLPEETVIYFAVTGYDLDGNESAFSKEITLNGSSEDLDADEE
jgi:hypothetical protein